MKRYPKAMTLAEDVSHKNKKSTCGSKSIFFLLSYFYLKESSRNLIDSSCHFE